MSPTVYLLIMLSVVGLSLYFFSSNPKWCDIGQIAFLAGIALLLLQRFR